MPAPIVALEHVCRSHDGGSVQALRDVSLAIGEGEFVAVTGPSGSGKSSLVHIMAGFDLPSSGIVRWRGRAVGGRRQWTDLRRSEIGIVFQDFLLLPTLTARENVELAMSGTGVGAVGRRVRATELLERVGLGARADHLPHALSGGERQRVAIARAIANRPKLLLCDEPTGNLDTASAALVADLLVSLRDRSGTALVIVTHDATLAARAPRRIRIVDGSVVQEAAN